MPRSTYVKTFDVTARSIEGGHYEIVVRDCTGQVVDEVQRRTMREANEELTRRLYVNVFDFPAVGIAFGRASLPRGGVS